MKSDKPEIKGDSYESAQNKTDVWMICRTETKVYNVMGMKKTEPS